MLQHEFKCWHKCQETNTFFQTWQLFLWKVSYGLVETISSNPNSPVPLLNLKKASGDNIFSGTTFIAKLCSGSRSQMAHPGSILFWYFLNGSVFFCHCVFLLCILCVISFWTLSGDLSKSLGKFRLKCKGTEGQCLCAWQSRLPGVCMHTFVQTQGNDHALQGEISDLTVWTAASAEQNQVPATHAWTELEGRQGRQALGAY